MDTFAISTCSPLLEWVEMRVSVCLYTEERRLRHGMRYTEDQDEVAGSGQVAERRVDVQVIM